MEDDYLVSKMACAAAAESLEWLIVETNRGRQHGLHDSCELARAVEAYRELCDVCGRLKVH